MKLPPATHPAKPLRSATGRGSEQPVAPVACRDGNGSRVLHDVIATTSCWIGVRSLSSVAFRTSNCAGGGTRRARSHRLDPIRSMRPGSDPQDISGQRRRDVLSIDPPRCASWRRGTRPSRSAIAGLGGTTAAQHRAERSGRLPVFGRKWDQAHLTRPVCQGFLQTASCLQTALDAN